MVNKVELGIGDIDPSLPMESDIDPSLWPKIMGEIKYQSYFQDKAKAWENECIAYKKCLFALAKEMARAECCMRSEVGYEEFWKILAEHNFISLHTIALKVIEAIGE